MSLTPTGFVQRGLRTLAIDTSPFKILFNHFFKGNELYNQQNTVFMVHLRSRKE